MAKVLTKPQPSSSIAGMLEPAITMQVIASPGAHTASIYAEPTPRYPSATERPAEAQSASPDVPTSHRQFSLTPGTDRVLKRLVTVYAEATGLDLRHSELLRAILLAVEHAMPELVREAACIGRLKRPKNDRSNQALREHLERRIAAAFVAGMRAAGTLNA